MVPGQYKPHNLCPSDITWRDGELEEIYEEKVALYLALEFLLSMFEKMILADDQLNQIFGE
jgi:hypothetical protein